jgi:aminoglycoside phosphotransferase (APT) family kinase protein
MQLSNRRLADSLIELLGQLSLRSDLPADVLFDLGIAKATASHLNQVNQSDGAAVRDYAARSATLARQMQNSPHADAEGIRARLACVVAAAEATAASPVAGEAAKQALSALLAETEADFAGITSDFPDRATPLFAAFATNLLDLHSHLPLFASADAGQEPESTAGESLTEANLAAYLADVLSDTSVRVSNITALPGGFGKETTLFTLDSAKLSADLVMRRDPPADALAGLDCHAASHEFPLLRAVHARGFPAPEPLFFAAETALIRGPAFTIMRRVPGKVAGDATGGSGQVSPHLQRTLAGIVAHLHNVAPLTELADNPMLDRALWTMSAQDCTRAYIATWHREFTATRHSPAPVLQGLFHWLLAHVPSSDAATTLVHGDIGFHNLLFHEGELTAVLDWEFGHVGDPAEDLGYIRSVMGSSLDWNLFLDAYRGGGRPVPSEERIAFFEIWSHARNAAASVMLTDQFETGRFRNIKFAALAMRYVPHFIARARALIADYDPARFRGS